MKIGIIKKVENKDRKFGSQKEYYVLHCTDNGTPLVLMLTQSQITKAVKRASDNPEDIPKLTRTGIFARINSWFRNPNVRIQS